MAREQAELDRALALANSVKGGWTTGAGLKAAADYLGAEIEHVGVAGRTLAYVNLGETYEITVAQEGHMAPELCSWGGWYEEAEGRHCEEEGVTRCPYCGEFTPLDKDHCPVWNGDVVDCESCGSPVD